jgi:hypothetical protein
MMEEDKKIGQQFIKEPDSHSNPLPHKVLSDSSFLSKVNKKTLVKGLLIITLLSCIFLNCLYGFGLPDTDVKCLEDWTHEKTANINKYLHSHMNVTHTITFFSSLCIDSIMLSICFFWVFKIKSWRFLICLLFFYGLRGMVQGLFQMRYPDGFLWSYPGIPSLAVSYLKTNDFFYSGHVGLPIIVACEFFKLKKTFFGFYAIFGCIVEFIVMIIMRGHYIIDLIFGIITAHYIFMMVDKYIYLLDNSIFSLKDDYMHVDQRSRNHKMNKSNTSREFPIHKIKKEFWELEETDGKTSTNNSDSDVNKK